MNDPHITRLWYKISHGDTIRYSSPPMQEYATELGLFRLADGELCVAPKAHFAHESDARTAIEPFLQTWEINADLVVVPQAIRFTFDRSDIIDRNPPPGGSVEVPVCSITATGLEPSIYVAHAHYPAPPTGFFLSPDLKVAHMRWSDFLAGREPLPGMAYFVLTVLEAGSLDETEWAGKKRQQAARKYHIELDVLKHFGRLTGTRGGPLARKAGAKDLTPAEKNWLEAATKLLVRRLGEFAAGADLKQIKLTDLPDL